MDATVSTRGRPAGRLTMRRRQVLAYIAQRGRPVTLGELVRGCGFADRATAKRTLRDLQDMGVLPFGSVRAGASGRPAR